jgi:hypothetical protein
VLCQGVIALIIAVAFVRFLMGGRKTVTNDDMTDGMMEEREHK